MKSKQTNIVLFDGVCNLCNSIVKFIIKRDLKEKFKFASLQSEIGQKLLKNCNLSTVDIDSVIFIKRERFYVKSLAVICILVELGGFWKIFYILKFMPRFFCDFVYNIIAKYRYKIFGKKESCLLQTSKFKNRFLG